MKIELRIDGVDYAVQPIVPPAIPAGLLLVPPGITPTIAHLDALNWTGVHDECTPGTAVGTTSYPVSVGGRQARAFPNKFTGNGGLRYHAAYGKDANAKNFVYAGDLWIDDNPAAIGQMELDNNQVTEDGKTYVFGVQCNANDGRWDITKQDDAGCHWVASRVLGSPQTWPAQKWLHFEIATHRDDAGVVFYDAVHFDGSTEQFEASMPSARDLGWEKEVMLVNVQIGGKGAGQVTVYGSNLQVARW